MAEKQIEFHPGAMADYATAFDWYFDRSHLAAQGFDEELARAVEQIKGNPRRWSANQDGTRRFLLRHFPFSIIYRELQSVIEIVAVAHARRRPDYWRRRL